VNALEVVDSHHHLWDTRNLHYPLFDTIDALNRPFTAADFEAEADAAQISQSICVEAASAGANGRAETEWLLREVDESRHVAAVVAWAPLEDPQLEKHLDWLMAQPGKPIVGVRRSFEFVDADFAASQAVVEGARLVGERGLVVDLVLFSPSLPATIALVDSCPNTRFVLDHLGKPPIRLVKQEPWLTHMRELAARPNVVAKLSGLPTEASRADWTTDDLRPYVEAALEAFGADRLLFGSDWPVVNLAGGLRPWLQAVRELLAPLDSESQDWIFGANARRIYSLQPGLEPQRPSGTEDRASDMH